MPTSKARNGKIGGVMIEGYEVVIGLEVHVQLATKSKIFSAASAAFGGDPNTHVDPLTFGLPGCLPVPNKKVIDYAIMLGLALNCNIREHNRFARKHYFYPDLPKAYQTSQFEEPICEGGSLSIVHEDAVRNIGITRIHMEEDAGKNIHDSRTASSLIDLNRAGVPLLEVVSEPDLRSPGEASSFLKTLRQIVQYLGVGDGNMEEGSLRCDANISLRPKGQMEYGTRTETKNLNSFKFVEKAINYEIARQLKILKAGEKVVQETRLFDSVTETTRSMRGKEESAEYRYFPCPDLPPLQVSDAWVAEIKNELPTLPQEKREELINAYGLAPADADTLTGEREVTEYFETVYDTCKNAKAATSWVTSELFGLLSKAGLNIHNTPVSAINLGMLVKRLDEGLINGKMAKDILEEMFESGKAPDEIIEAKGLKQVSDPEEVKKIVLEVLQENADQVKDYLSGNERVFGFLVGQVMKKSAGKANPKLVNVAIKELLKDF